MTAVRRSLDVHNPIKVSGSHKDRKKKRIWSHFNCDSRHDGYATVRGFQNGHLQCLFPKQNFYINIASLIFWSAVRKYTCGKKQNIASLFSANT